MTNKCKSATRQTVQSDFKCCDQRMRWTSIRSDAFSFILALPGLWSNMQTCWSVAHYKGQRFHAASKVLVDAREHAEAKQYELKQNAEFGFGVNRREAFRNASKLPYLRKARAPLCGACNYQPCAQQEGIIARIKWVPNACFKLYAFKALMGLLWTWNKLAKIPT